MRPLTSIKEPIDRDAPLRLSVAASVAFPDGSMTASGLRREAARGRLLIERIAGKDYTTLENIERMREACRVQAKDRDSTCVAQDRASDARPSGLSGTATAISPRDALQARLIKARLAGRPAPPPFRYADFGALATIGRAAAVVQLGRVQLRGFVAWLFWCVAHIYFLVGFRNRIQVGLDWLWSYLTFERGARLITGEDQAARALNSHIAGTCDCPSL